MVTSLRNATTTRGLVIKIYNRPRESLSVTSVREVLIEFSSLVTCVSVFAYMGEVMLG